MSGVRFAEIGEETKDWSHKIIDKEGKPHFEVEFKGEVAHFSAEDITAVMLKRMKETTEGLCLHDELFPEEPPHSIMPLPS